MLKTSNSFVEDINKINISQMIWDIESEIEKINNYNYAWKFSNHEKLIPKIDGFLRSLDFYHIDIITDFGFYWCGILTAEPWCETEEREEVLLNMILQNNTRLAVVENELVLRFTLDPTSPLANFFNQYLDGYDGNIVYSINLMLKKIETVIRKFLKNKIPEGAGVLRNKWGEWFEYFICPHCESGAWVGPSSRLDCPECGQSLVE